MSEQYEKFRELLNEMFMFDRADLDFGMYRILNKKRSAIEEFLNKRMRVRIHAILDQSQNRAVKAPSYADLENNVYNHLTTFFSRYYDKGDFISRRRYNRNGSYAIPYNGEEVKLHWANADQYYVKSDKYFRNYTFKTNDGSSVNFQLREADTELNNNKESDDDKRKFIVSGIDLPIDKAPLNEIVEINGDNEITIFFEYAPHAELQKSLNQRVSSLVMHALNRVAPPHTINQWNSQLMGQSTVQDKPVLLHHIDTYTAVNSYDFFIHKNLGAFLRRELDFYVKNEIFNLDGIDEESAVTVDSFLDQVRAVRTVGHEIIAFLHQIEEFQRKLWLKKKFVVSTDYCLTVDRIPARVKTRVISDLTRNKEQIAEWQRLFHIEELEGGTQYPLSEKFIRSQPHLVMDTKFLPPSLKDALLEAFDDIDAACDGLLIHSENFQALNLLQTRYREQVKCIYIDPPYNTGNDGFIYKDRYQHSSWATMISDRLTVGMGLLCAEGAIFTSIDEVEQPSIRFALDTVIGRDNFIADMVWAAGRKNDSRLVSISHEYIIAYARNRERLNANKTEWRQRKKGLEDIYAQYKLIKREHGTNYTAMTAALKTWYRELSDGHPAKAHKHYSHIDARGIYFPDNISWPGGGGPKYEVLHPKTGLPVKIPSRGWIFPDPAKLQALIDDDRIHFGPDEQSVPCTKSYLADREYQAPYSVFYQDGRAATKRLRDVLGTDNFGYPKDETVVADLIDMVTTKYDIVLDYFAGSGTTGHSVIKLNREGNGCRKYILIEMSEYFDTITKPRIQKVVYSDTWKNGKPVDRAGTSHMFKYVRLESYEDTLNNLTMTGNALSRQMEQEQVGSDLHADYMLTYMLDAETASSSVFLGADIFRRPFSQIMRISTGSVGHSEGRLIDVVETFNYLIGLRVHKCFSYNADTLRVISGTTNTNNQRVIVIWRDLEELNDENIWDFLSGHMETIRQLNEAAIIYINGDSTGGRLVDPKKLRIIDGEFKRLMFDDRNVE